jgi:molecular chaperone GrpE (heat shock protein)
MEPEVGLETVEREAGERCEGPGLEPAPQEALPAADSTVPPETAPPSAPPPEAAPHPQVGIRAGGATPSGMPAEESPARPAAAPGEKWFDLRIAVPEAAGQGGEHEHEPMPVEESRELQAAGSSAASLEAPVAGPREESLAPQGPTLEDLSQEIRRVGRELFKTNRAAERNQALFESTLGELRQLSAAIAEARAQTADPVFLAKAALCRDLLTVVDALEASLAAADEVRAQLREQAALPAQGLAFRFAVTRELQASLTVATEAMGKWADGQPLLYERLMLALQSAGLRAIVSVGRPFDPALHRAVSVERRRDVPAGTIVGEELKGYLLDGKVLRYGEVVVARNE